jgi:hypothetical protein
MTRLVVPYYLRDRLEFGYRRGPQYPLAILRVIAHQRPFAGGQRAGFSQHGIRGPNLPDVVEPGGDAQAIQFRLRQIAGNAQFCGEAHHPVAVGARVRVPHIERDRQRLDRTAQLPRIEHSYNPSGLAITSPQRIVGFVLLYRILRPYWLWQCHRKETLDKYNDAE